MAVHGAQAKVLVSLKSGAGSNADGAVPRVSKSHRVAAPYESRRRPDSRELANLTITEQYPLRAARQTREIINSGIHAMQVVEQS